MIGMQYKITLPKDYDMGIIRKRVQDNAYKTDGFPGLYFKLYLITEVEKSGNLYNSYAPLYLWHDHQGMNKFIFEGFYDNILNSFGWQQIQIGVPLVMDLEKDFTEAKYVMEDTGRIPERQSLMNMPFQNDVKNSIGNLLVYNPDKWGYSQFSFYQEKPENDHAANLKVYEILHVSQGKGGDGNDF